MSRVTLSASRLTFRLRLDEHHEHTPKLYVWLSQNVSSDLKLLVKSDEPVYWEFDTATGIVHPQEKDIPLQERVQNCNLNVDVFCDVYTKYGEHGKNQAGSVSIPLRELLGSAQDTRTYNFSIPSWGDPNARGANRDPAVENNKGTIHLDGPVDVMIDGVVVPPLDAAGVAVAEKVDVAKEQVSRHYMSSLVAFCRKLGYTWEATSLINAYAFSLCSR
jgi:hypothetical protein